MCAMRRFSRITPGRGCSKLSMLTIDQISEKLDGLAFAEAAKQLRMFSSYERTAALVLVMARAPTPAESLRTFLDFGDLCDAPWWNRSYLADELRQACAQVDLADFLGPAERRFFDSLPSVVTVWRGCEQGRERGLSWTTDRATAEGFARGKRYINKNPTLVRAEIPKRHIFAVFVGRNESEIVVDPRRLRKLRTSVTGNNHEPTRETTSG
jgi:hypothetical protein